jgi:hypothetical protein
VKNRQLQAAIIGIPQSPLCTSVAKESLIPFYLEADFNLEHAATCTHDGIGRSSMKEIQWMVKSFPPS